MKTLTITMPDEVLCVALTTVAIKGTGVHTFTNCFSVQGKKTLMPKFLKQSKVMN